MKFQIKGLVKDVAPKLIFSIGALVLTVGLSMLARDIYSKREVIMFAYNDPEAVMWVKTNLEAKELNTRKALQEELNPKSSASGSVSFLSPVGDK